MAPTSRGRAAGYRRSRVSSILVGISIAVVTLELVCVSSVTIGMVGSQGSVAVPRLVSSTVGIDSAGAAELLSAEHSLNSSHSPAASKKGPSARWGAAMTYDLKNGYVVLFGGETGTGYLNDTWKFAAGVWTKLSPTSHPSARSLAAISYDAKDGYVVLFGGVVNGMYLDDTWKFVGGQWTNLSPTKHPAARSVAAMSYDAGDGYVVLFGGISSSGATLGDTWTYLGGVWTKLSPSTHPSARYGAGLTDDTGDGYLLLFGGCGSENGLCAKPVHDTWSFADGSWMQLSPSKSPSSRGGMVLVDDVSAGYVVMFGGSNNTTVFGDTWTFLAGKWTHLSLSVSPSARAVPGAAFDDQDGAVVIFGGLKLPFAPVNNTWSFSAGAWSKV